MVPLALRAGFGKRVVSDRLLATAAVCSVLPDVDVLAFHFGIPYASEFGHRGFTHSIFFALALALVCTSAYRWLRVSPWAALIVPFVSTASHGFFDAFTNGGLGIAFFWPLSDQRFFFPVRVLDVSPIGVNGFFGQRSWDVLYSEIIWMWLPLLVFGALAYTIRHLLKQALRR